MKNLVTLVLFLTLFGISPVGAVLAQQPVAKPDVLTVRGVRGPRESWRHYLFVLQS
jgi:hypothetical protein